LLTGEELAIAHKVLQTLASCPTLLTSDDPRYDEVRRMASRLIRAGRDQDRKESRQRDRDLLDRTGIRSAELDTHAGETISEGELQRPRACYVCNRPFTHVHFFYDSLCPSCAIQSYEKREATANLDGRIALLTGGRIKIGYQVSLKLLRAGARVLATTRFVHNALHRYAQEPDFDTWRDRLSLHALDLRHLAAVEQFAEHLKQELPYLDILINNAAQTVRRPPAYYRHLLDEMSHDLPADAGRLLGYSPEGMSALAASAGDALWPALLTQVPLVPGDEHPDEGLFPVGARDAHGQQVDLRTSNSWSSKGDNVSPVELLEVQAVNSIAPFLLLTRLGPLLRRSPHPARYVINVSAVEGNFRAGKSGKHPHTNMVKAALNMLTRTLAESYAGNGIYLNSVDTGWISNEAPRTQAEQMEAAGFRLPLDVIDAAARVCDPIFTGVRSGEYVWGKYLKDFREVSW
jgi:NAD(P)-dependent dehydrogenase (short-subunit alcohol dehydrogenase family)